MVNATQKQNIQIELKWYEKPEQNSPLSESKLLSVPKITTNSGKKGTISLTSKSILVLVDAVGHKLPPGIAMTVIPIIKGETIELNGSISVTKPPVFQKDKNGNSHIVKTTDVVYNITVKEQDKFYHLPVFKDNGKFYEILIKAGVVK